jgi:hypothetical protein
VVVCRRGTHRAVTPRTITSIPIEILDTENGRRTSSPREEVRLPSLTSRRASAPFALLHDAKLIPDDLIGSSSGIQSIGRFRIGNR